MKVADRLAHLFGVVVVETDKASLEPQILKVAPLNFFDDSSPHQPPTSSPPTNQPRNETLHDGDSSTDIALP